MFNHKVRVKSLKTQGRKEGKQRKQCKQLRGLFFLGRKKSQGRKDKAGQSSSVTPLAASTFGSTNHYMSIDWQLQTHCFISSIMSAFQEGRVELCHIPIPSCKIIFKVGDVATPKKLGSESKNEQKRYCSSIQQGLPPLLFVAKYFSTMTKYS